MTPPNPDELNATLRHAIQQGYKTMIPLLIQQGADLQDRNVRQALFDPDTNYSIVQSIIKAFFQDCTIHIDRITVTLYVIPGLWTRILQSPRPGSAVLNRFSVFFIERKSMTIKDKVLPRERIRRNLELLNVLAYINDNGIDSILIKKELLDVVILKTENGCGVID